MSVGMTRRRLLALGATAVVVGTPTIGLLATRDTHGAATADEADPPAASGRRTAKVTRRDLLRTIPADGTIGYDNRRIIQGAGAGIITGLPAAGTMIQPNEPLYWIDGHPGPVLMIGTLPMWRTLQSGVDDGADVQQVEGNLAYMGFTDADMTIDEKFTTSTRSAIRLWQKFHGLDKTGRVGTESIWFSTGAVRVAEVSAELGGSANGEIITVSATERVVKVDLEARYGQYAHEGDSVSLTLADGATATGTITSVATTATVVEGEQGEPATTTIAIQIAPDGTIDALDESPVEVAFTSDKITGALAVPVDAIVATAGGPYAVEVVDADGASHLVEVTIGRFADGWVQITGNVTDGQTVVTA